MNTSLIIKYKCWGVTSAAVTVRVVKMFTVAEKCESNRQGSSNHTATMLTKGMGTHVSNE
jgi:hypothetical protein